MSAAHRHLACLATVAPCELFKAENRRNAVAFHRSSNQLSEYLLPQMCQQYDDSSARGLSGISGYLYPCLYWPDPHSVCCALSTPKTIYVTMTHTTQAGTHDGRLWSVAGDSYGMLHTFDPSSLGDLLSMPSHVLQHSWSRGYRLDSQVSLLRKPKLE